MRLISQYNKKYYMQTELGWFLDSSPLQVKTAPRIHSKETNQSPAAVSVVTLSICHAPDLDLIFSGTQCLC